MKTVRLIDIKSQNYSECLEFMRTLVAARISALDTGVPVPDTLIMVEHQPVLTLGRRGSMADVVVPETVLEQKGIEVHRIERGGLITYHGPGQLVAYPVFHLKPHGLGVSEFVHTLEAIIIATLADFGVKAARREGFPGVWVGPEKIASIGLAVRRGITFHGLAMNYAPDMSHFQMINPCGLSVGMTSISRETGRAVDPEQVRACMKRHFEDLLDIKLEPWSQDQAREEVNRHVSQSSQAAVA